MFHLHPIKPGAEHPALFRLPDPVAVGDTFDGGPAGGGIRRVTQVRYKADWPRYRYVESEPVAPAPDPAEAFGAALRRALGRERARARRLIARLERQPTATVTAMALSALNKHEHCHRARIELLDLAQEWRDATGKPSWQGDETADNLTAAAELIEACG